MPTEGQLTRSSRWSHDHPGSLGEPDTGQRGLDIPGITKTLTESNRLSLTKGRYDAKMQPFPAKAYAIESK